MCSNPDTVTPAVSATNFRLALSRVPTGVVAATTMHEGHPIGMLIGTFTSVSLDPLLVGFLGDRKSSTLPLLLNASTVSFSLLEESNSDVVSAFRRPPHERFDAIPWKVDPESGAPELTGSPLVVFGRPRAATDAGDHLFAQFEVTGLRTNGPVRPLVFCGGRMTRTDPCHMIDSDMWQLGWTN